MRNEVLWGSLILGYFSMVLVMEKVFSISRYCMSTKSLAGLVANFDNVIARFNIWNAPVHEDHIAVLKEAVYLAVFYNFLPQPSGGHSPTLFPSRWSMEHGV